MACDIQLGWQQIKWSLLWGVGGGSTLIREDKNKKESYEKVSPQTTSSPFWEKIPQPLEVRVHLDPFSTIWSPGNFPWASSKAGTWHRNRETSSAAKSHLSLFS